MVNEVCQRVVGALEKPMQTNSHMGLVMALAKNNGLVVEAYARLLIQSGLRILTAGVAEDNSQKRLSAIQMVNFLMKCLDPKSLFSELGLIIEELEKCKFDKMPYVKAATFEALQTAKKVAGEKGSVFEGDMGSINRSNFCRRGNYPSRNMSSGGDQLTMGRVMFVYGSNYYPTHLVGSHLCGILCVLPVSPDFTVNNRNRYI